MTISRNIFYGLVILLLMVSACQPKPKPIDFGQEACAYCSMTIIDKQHASQIVTNKGKVYSFDAIECMLRSDHMEDHTSLAYMLCNDYMEPGAMIDATQATFLISERIPSPMGGYLSGFTSLEFAKKAVSDGPAEFLSWEELYVRYRDNP